MLAFCILAIAIHAEPIPKAKDEVSDLEKSIVQLKQKLNEECEVSLEKKSLNEFVSFIKSKTNAEVILDKNAIMVGEQDYDADIISSKYAKIKLKDGLNSAVEHLGLKVGVVGNKVFISSEDGIIHRQMRLNVDVSEGNTGKILSDLAKKTGVNIVIDPRIKKPIDEAKCELTLNDSTLETAVRLVAEVGGFRAIRMGNVLFVTSLERAKELRSDADGLTQPQSGTNVFPAIDR